jgi:hypothetical protein
MHKFFVLTGPLVFLILAGCWQWTQWSNSKPESFLIIAIDGLGFSDVNCMREPHSGKSGFDILCQDSVRFTHSYSTSNLTLPAITSLLTFQYPFQNGVRDNSSFLKSSIISLPEIAHQFGFKTSFISGGPAVLRRSGIQQGFDVFDDNFSISQKNLFRPATQSIQIFQQWLLDIGRVPFLSVLYLADVNFKDVETTNELGEVRSFSTESQIEEIDETLFNLFSKLKQQGVWDNTWIILVGLNSRTDGIIHPFDQKSSSLQIATLIKTSQKHRDLGINWSIDPSISLIDVGYTIAKKINPQLPLVANGWSPVDLYPALNQPALDVPKKRWVLSESSWPKWRKNLQTYYSFRQDQYLITATNKERAYNTLVDRNESASVPVSEPLFRDAFSDINQYLKNFGWIENSADDMSTEIQEANQKIDKQNPCFQLLNSEKPAEHLKRCDDPLSLTLFDWLSMQRTNSLSNLDWARKKLIRAYYNAVVDRNIYSKNKDLNWVLDASLNPHSQLSPGEYFLSQTEFAKEKIWLNREIQLIKAPTD